jgi:hypothetical protein
MGSELGVCGDGGDGGDGGPRRRAAGGGGLGGPRRRAAAGGRRYLGGANSRTSGGCVPRRLRGESKRDAQSNLRGDPAGGGRSKRDAQSNELRAASPLHAPDVDRRGSGAGGRRGSGADFERAGADDFVDASGATLVDRDGASDFGAIPTLFEVNQEAICALDAVRGVALTH